MAHSASVAAQRLDVLEAEVARLRRVIEERLASHSTTKLSLLSRSPRRRGWQRYQARRLDRYANGIAKAARRADGINQANAAVGVRLRSAITEAVGILVAITADKTRKTAA